MKVKIEFEINSKLELQFATIIQDIAKIFKSYKMKWKYNVVKNIEATQNDDGTIDYEVKYYNGGCSREEAIAEAVQKLDN